MSVCEPRQSSFSALLCDWLLALLCDWLFSRPCDWLVARPWDWLILAIFSSSSDEASLLSSSIVSPSHLSIKAWKYKYELDYRDAPDTDLPEIRPDFASRLIVKYRSSRRNGHALFFLMIQAFQDDQLRFPLSEFWKLHIRNCAVRWSDMANHFIKNFHPS